MAEIPIYQVDAFASAVFEGNPAAVCPLEAWLDDARLQAIAAENNLAETAFFVEQDGLLRLRWFTPLMEVDLCGHATLAAAYVLLTEIYPGRDRVVFETPSGKLTVFRRGELLEMDFPCREPVACQAPGELIDGLRATPREVLRSRDYLAVFDTAREVASLSPDMELLSRLDSLGVIATAPGEEVDFVSRFFAPAAGIPEDPVTGSAHSTLIPYWAGRLGRRRLEARQISRRGGHLSCELRGDRVSIAGRAVLYLRGTIYV